MVIKKILIIASFCALFSCETTDKTTGENLNSEKNIQVQSKKDIINVIGVYVGNLPCDGMANCTSIQTKISINADETYEKTTKIVGDNAKEETEIGEYYWSEDGNILVLEGIMSDPIKYDVTKDAITQEDSDGNFDKKQYVLTKRN